MFLEFLSLIEVDHHTSFPNTEGIIVQRIPFVLDEVADLWRPVVSWN